VGEFWSRQHHCRALASDALGRLDPTSATPHPPWQEVQP